jgi:molybdopterin-binding protein
MRISARSQLEATIESIHVGDVMTEVVARLKGGECVVSAITSDSARKLGLAAGKAVTVIVKSTEVMLGVSD